jgi:DNA-binding transcriptional LysR family regulator
MPLSDVRLPQLLALRSVAEEGSFIGAADALGLSQAAISQQIAAVERAVGQSLFDRPGGPRPVVLTPAGRLLLRHAQAICDRIQVAEQELADLASGIAGRLTCGTFQSASVRLLPQIVRQVRAQAPNLAISLVEHTSNEALIDLLVSGEIDVTFLEGEITDTRLHTTVIGTDPFVVVLPADDPHAQDAAYPSAALTSAALIGEHDCSTQRRIDSGLRALGITPRYAFRSGDNGAMQGMVRAGLGPAVMPQLAIDIDDPGIVVKPLDPPIPPRLIVLATHRGATPLPAEQTFTDVAVSVGRAYLTAAGGR